MRRLLSPRDEEAIQMHRHLVTIASLTAILAALLYVV
jgi:hypothetical protein